MSLQHNKPLYSFEDNADYVYDVMWSPVHPAIFASVDGMGRLDLWNLNKDTEVNHRMLLQISNWTALLNVTNESKQYAKIPNSLDVPVLKEYKQWQMDALDMDVTGCVFAV